MNVANNDRPSLYLLLSLVLFFSLNPFIAHHRLGEFILVVAVYVTLIAAIMKLHRIRTHRWLAIFVGVPYALAFLAGIVHPVHPLIIVDYLLLTAFFGFSSVALFTYLGKPGAITNGRVYASVSLYLMLATFWSVLYHVIEEIHPGSFVQSSTVGLGMVPHSGFLYFSLITLTTVGYGDILPVTPVARMCAALEGATGVMYVAITVARLVGSYQTAGTETLEK